MKRHAAWIVWPIVALSLVLFVAGVIYSALLPVAPTDRRSALGPVDPINLSLLADVAVGALIALRRPGNPVGWLFCASGLLWQVYGTAQAYASYLALVTPAAFHPDSLWLVLAINLWVVSFSLLPFMLFVFPSGHLLSRRWVVVVWPLAVIVFAGYFALASDFRAGHLHVNFPSPLSVLGLRLDDARQNQLTHVLSIPIFLGCYFLSGVALLLRWHRAAREERQQLKWFVSAAALVLLVLFVPSTFHDALRALDPGSLHAADFLYGIPYALAVAMVPVAAGIAVLKYRLYDIDLIIRRTVLYGLLTALLALVYFGSVVALQALFTALTGAARSELVTVLSTLAIAALFVPLRNRLQGFIDRRFYRHKYDAARTLADFGAQIRDEVNLDDLSERLLAVVDDTMEPVSVALWLKSQE